jgi:HSP90 family molecular chaperone
MMRREGDAELPESKPDLELNPDHPMIVKLQHTRSSSPELAQQVAEQIFDNALVAAGLLEDPRAMLARMNSLLEKLLA